MTKPARAADYLAHILVAIKRILHLHSQLSSAMPRA